MPFKHHPSESLLLSVLNGTAASERDDVSAHLAVCARCRSVAERYGAILSDLRGMDGTATGHHRDMRPIGPPVRTVRFPKALVFKAAGGALAASLLLLIFGWPRHIQTVSANEILSRVETAQGTTTGARHFYRLRMGQTTCSTSDAHWGQDVSLNTSPCARAHLQLLQTHWNDREMLSARSYRQWHDGLSKHRDFIYHQEPYWTIKTDTDEGSLRSASLRVRASDYHPVELTLEFASLDPISVVEDEPSELKVNSAAAPLRPVQSERLEHIDDPADAVEVQAWRLLHELGADSGWEATVVRNGSSVKVSGLVNDTTRQSQLTEAFLKLSGVSVDLNEPASLPQRGGNGDSLPLAESTLEAEIPDAHERGERTTQIANASQAVLGKAFLYNRLIERQRVIGESSSASALDPIIRQERADLLRDMTRLSGLLEPFPEMRGRRPLGEPLSYSQAQSLDTAILSLFNAAPKRSASLQETTSLVRSLLPRGTAD
jgi:hypothetical protein